MWNFFIVMMTPILINNIGWRSYIIFTCTNAAFVPIIYFFYPETSNIYLEDIDKIFLPPEMRDYASRNNSLAVAEVQREDDKSDSSKGEIAAHEKISEKV